MQNGFCFAAEATGVKGGGSFHEKPKGGAKIIKGL